jgi:O-antigen ligase
MFSLSVRGVGSTVELATVSLTAPDGTELLANRDFSSTLAHWFPVAQSYFLPWHIDNLYLELLIERGVVGLALYVWLLAYALRTLLTRPRGHGDIAPFLAASLVGAMLLGTVSSIMDVPRVALLLLLLVIAAVQLNTGAHPRDDLPV